jgi:hypothetical protein
MPRQRTGRPRCLHDQCKRRVGQDDGNGKFITNGRVITPATCADDITSQLATTRDVVDELEEWDAPLLPLAALLASDASYSELVSRLKLNFAIRCLLDAIREADCAGAQ